MGASQPPVELPSRWALAGLLAALAVVLLAAFPYFEQIRNANEVPRLLQAMAVVEQGEWAIDGPSRRGLPVGPDVARSPVDDRLYPNKPPGATVVGVLAYHLARASSETPTLRSFTWWARLLAGSLPALLIVGVAWRRFVPRYGPWVVAAAALGVVLGTPLFAYSRLFYGHALAACLLYLGLAGVTSEAADSRRRSMHLALGSVAAAAAITVEYGVAFCGLPIALALLAPLVRAQDGAARRATLQRAGLGLGCALLPVALLAMYQRAVFGSALATGYHHAADPGFAELHGQGLLGLGAPRGSNLHTHWLAPDTGLLAWSPLVLVGLIGLVRLARGQGTEPLTRVARLELGVFATMTLMGLGLSFEGGWRIGPRYLVVALPTLILGLAEVLAWLRERAPGWASSVTALGLGIAAGWSLVANSLAATLWPHIDPTNIHEPFGAVLLPLWREGFAPYGLAVDGASLALALPVALAVGSWAGVYAKARPRLFAALMVGGVLGALGLAQVPRSVTPHPKSERNLSYIQRVYEPKRTRPAADARPAERAGKSLKLEPI